VQEEKQELEDIPKDGTDAVIGKELVSSRGEKSQ
jgi:hypothetical protein